MLLEAQTVIGNKLGRNRGQEHEAVSRSEKYVIVMRRYRKWQQLVEEKWGRNYGEGVARRIVVGSELLH